MFQYSELIIGEKDCVLTTVEITKRVREEKEIAEEQMAEMNEVQFEQTLDKFNKMDEEEQE